MPARSVRTAAPLPWSEAVFCDARMVTARVADSLLTFLEHPRPWASSTSPATRRHRPDRVYIPGVLSIGVQGFASDCSIVDHSLSIPGWALQQYRRRPPFLQGEGF